SAAALLRRRHRGRAFFGAQPLRPPAVLVVVLPERREMRQHLLREQADIGLGHFGRHRAEVQQRQQVADAQPLYAIEDALAHGFWTADDDEAAIEEIPRFQLAQVERRADRAAQRPKHAFVLEAAGDLLIL